MNRYYLRCKWCLSVGTVEAEYPPSAMNCGHCGAPVENMGRVVRGGRVIGERSVCDERCTCAIGPNCDCQCGGENHGAGLKATVEIVGSALTLRTPKAKDVERGTAIREAVKARREAISNDSAYRAKCAGAYVSGAQFARYLTVRRKLEALNAIVALRSHAGREKALAAFDARQ